MNFSNIHLHFLKPQNSISLNSVHIYTMLYIDDIVHILLTLLLHCIVVVHVVCCKYDVLVSTTHY